jgi:hypothetical protein
VSDSFEAVRKELSKIEGIFWDKFIVDLEVILRQEFYPILVEYILTNYGELPQGPSDDPTALEKWTDEFKNHLLSSNVVENSIKVTNDSIEINMGDRKFLGDEDLGDDESPTPIIWMIYFISDTAAQGIIGKFAFISRAEYEQSRGEGTYDEKWGRFSQGFMVSEEQFKSEGWEKVVGSFSANEHPLSKMLAETGPVNIFDEAFKQIQESENNISSFINTTIKKALSELKT